MINYREVHAECINVFLDKKRVGHIVRVASGYQYRPRGKNKQSFYGKVLPSINDVKASLEDN